MKNRTDFVNIGWKEQLAQQLRTYRDGLQTLLWGVLGLVVGLGNMMLEVSPFGAALCAAVPLQHLLPAAIGSAAGSLLLSSLSQLGGAHAFTVKYAAAIILIAAARKTLEKNNLLGGWVGAALDQCAAACLCRDAAALSGGIACSTVYHV